VARSVKKGPFIEHHLLKRITDAVASGNRKVIRTWSRRSMVVPEAVGLTIAIHNGKKFHPVIITENMIGHKFGEFSPTRVFNGHAEKKAASSGPPPAAKK
jgi:small subunit ribosomal protein S19